MLDLCVDRTVHSKLSALNFSENLQEQFASLQEVFAEHYALFESEEIKRIGSSLESVADHVWYGSPEDQIKRIKRAFIESIAPELGLSRLDVQSIFAFPEHKLGRQ